MRSLSWEMFREHRATYIGVGAVVLFAMTILSSVAAALIGVANKDGLPQDRSGISQADAQRMQLLTDGSTSFLATTLMLTGFVMIFMVASATSFAIAERRQELALLRLTGATSGQVRWITILEILIISAISSTLGSILGVALATPLVTLLANFGLAPEGVIVSLRWYVLLACAFVGCVVSLGGAWAAARSITRIDPVAALGVTGIARKPMTVARWLVGVFAAGIVILVLALPIDTGEFQTMTLLTSFVAIVSLTAFAPVLVPFLARLFVVPATVAAPAAGTMAIARVGWASRRTAALAVPILVLMGVSGPLFMIAQTSAAMNQTRFSDALIADIVVEPGAEPITGTQLDAIRRIPGVATATQLVTSSGWTYEKDNEDRAWVSWVDPSQISDVATVKVIAGNIRSLSGDVVATTDTNARLGKTITLIDPTGEQRVATIGAVVQPTSLIQAEIIAASNFAPAFQEPRYVVQQQTWAVIDPTADVPQVQTSIDRAAPGAHALTKSAWLEAGTAASQAQQVKGLLAMIGAGVLLAAFSMAQTTLNALRERRTEFRLLRTLGTTRPQIYATVLAESMIILVTAAVLIAVLLVTTYIRLAQMIAYQGSTASPVLPLPLLAAVFAGCALLTFLAAISGVSWSLRGPNAQRSHAPFLINEKTAFLLGRK